MKKVLCIGDSCMDILIPYGEAMQGLPADIRMSCGGTAANTASGLGRLGVPCAFLGKAGDDYSGRMMRQSLVDDGVDVSHFTLDRQLVSVQILSVIGKDRDRFNFLMPKERPSHLEIYSSDLTDDLLDFDIIHTSGLMLFEEPAASSVCAFLKKTKQAGKTVSLDINMRIETGGRDTSRLLEAVSCTDYLFGSAAEELIPLSGKKTEEEAAEFFMRQGCTVIARKGSRGSDLYSANGISHCSGFRVDVADTVGAGDCFNSGFLYALSRGLDASEANRIGCAAAALSLRKKGARNCPEEKELLAFLGENCEN